MNKIVMLSIICLLNAGCVLNMSMVHTQGEATDVIDDTDTNDTNVSPVVTLPKAI